MLLLIFLMQFSSAWSQDALGHVSVDGNDGQLSLRIISVADAISAGNGVVKIRLADGTIGAADLVVTSDAHASPVRIQTPYGTRSWRKESQFSYAYGGDGSDLFTGLALTSDGGFALGGWTDSWGAGSNDQFMVKTSGSGGLSWAGVYGSGDGETSYALVERTEGGYLLLGTKSSGQIHYMYMNFIDAAGNSTLGGYFPADSGYTSGYDAIQCADADFVGAGSAYKFATGRYEVYVKKFDASGNNIWGWFIGSDYSSTGKGIVQRPDGGYAVGGYISTESSGDNVYFLMIDAEGESEISYSIGGSGADVAESICLAADNGFALLGRTVSFGAGSWDFYVVKRDASGAFDWATTFGGSDSDLGDDITATSDGGYAITGRTSSFGAGGLDLWLIKTDSLGNPQWSWVFGGTGNDAGYDIMQGPDGCYYVGGITSSYGEGGNDGLLVKFTPDGSACLGYAIGFSSRMQPLGDDDHHFKAQKVEDFTVTKVQPLESIMHPLATRQDRRFVPETGQSRDFVTPTVTTVCN